MDTKTHMQRCEKANDVHPKALCGDFHPGTSTQCWCNVTCKDCLRMEKLLKQTDSATYVGTFPKLYEARYHGNTIKLQGEE
jgi:hypothetical protein